MAALASRGMKRKLLAGTAAALFSFPLLIVAVNLTWLQGYNSWVFSRFTPLRLVEYWWTGMVQPLSPAENVGIFTGVSFPRSWSIFSCRLWSKDFRRCLPC